MLYLHNEILNDFIAKAFNSSDNSHNDLVNAYYYFSLLFNEKDFRVHYSKIELLCYNFATFERQECILKLVKI